MLSPTGQQLRLDIAISLYFCYSSGIPCYSWSIGYDERNECCNKHSTDTVVKEHLICISLESTPI